MVLISRQMLCIGEDASCFAGCLNNRLFLPLLSKVKHAKTAKLKAGNAAFGNLC